jgi:hypothetical protein
MQLKGFNSLTILGAWTLWTQRNKCVFDGATPDLARALSLSGERGKEVVVDGWGSWNFFLNGPYLCRLERKEVCFFGRSFSFKGEPFSARLDCVGVC